MSLASAIDLQQHDDTPAEDHIVHLGGSAWRDHSTRLPGLDLDLLTRFLDQPTAYDAIQGFRGHLGKQLGRLP